MERKSKIPSIEVIKKQIMVTVNVAWRNDIDFSRIDAWLENFNGEALGSEELEKNLAMWLLYNFVFYNEDEIKHLCKLMLKKYLHISLEQENIEIEDINFILSKTNFLGLGKSSESGAYVLYLFRQENDLPLRFFSDRDRFIEDENIVFIDDMTLSGDQALRNMKKVKYAGAELKSQDIKDGFIDKISNSQNDNVMNYIWHKLNCNKNNKDEIVETLNKRIIQNKYFYKEIKKYIDINQLGSDIKNLIKGYDDIIEDKVIIKKLNRLLLENLYKNDIEKSVNNLNIHNWYMITFIASCAAIKKLEQEGMKVISCIELDEYAKVFSNDSMTFRSYPNDKIECEKMCRHYGEKLKPEYPLGYDNSQYMFGLYYTIPNNTLPIFWANNNWTPLFVRHEKNYTGDVKDVFGRYV